MEISNLNQLKVITDVELKNAIKKEYGYLKDSSIRWAIHDLGKQGIITKVGSQLFYLGKKAIFQSSTSSKIKEKIILSLKRALPMVKVVVYESLLLNEWVNHQISRNVIFVDVEKIYMNDVFHVIKEEVKNQVFLKPSLNDFYLYLNENIVVVSNLISQAPLIKGSYEIRLEKLIVDLLANDFIKEFISDDELKGIVETMFKTYIVNEKTIIAYARRRKMERVIIENIPKIYLGKGNIND